MRARRPRSQVGARYQPALQSAPRNAHSRDDAPFAPRRHPPGRKRCRRRRPCRGPVRSNDRHHPGCRPRPERSAGRGRPGADSARRNRTCDLCRDDGFRYLRPHPAAARIVRTHRDQGRQGTDGADRRPDPARGRDPEPRPRAEGRGCRGNHGQRGRAPDARHQRRDDLAAARRRGDRGTAHERPQLSRPHAAHAGRLDFPGTGRGRAEYQRSARHLQQLHRRRRSSASATAATSSTRSTASSPSSNRATAT